MRLLLPLLLCTAALPAVEQPPARPADRVAAVFARLDANKDGSIDKDEWMPLRTRYAQSKLQQEHSKAYDKADVNDDGQLSQDEIRNFPHWPGFEKIDADKNGLISKAEWTASAGELKAAWERKQP